MRLVSPVIMALRKDNNKDCAIDASALCKDGNVRLDLNMNPSRALYDRDNTDYLIRAMRLFSDRNRLGLGRILLCNGLEGAVDLLYRCFCNPSFDNVITLSPTRPLYEDVALMNGVGCRKVALSGDFALRAEDVFALCDNHTKMIFLCSPNDPTGNLLSVDEIVSLAELFDGIVVVDETYHAFSKIPSWKTQLSSFPNLIVLDTMDISCGASSLNVGCVSSSAEIIDVLKLLYGPYRLGNYVAKAVCSLLENCFEQDRSNRMLITEKLRVMSAVAQLPECKRMFKSDSNFFLAEFDDNRKVADYLRSFGVFVNYCSGSDLHGKDFLRISVGTKSENNLLLSVLRRMGDRF